MLQCDFSNQDQLSKFSANITIKTSIITTNPLQLDYMDNFWKAIFTLDEFYSLKLSDFAGWVWVEKDELYDEFHYYFEEK